MDLNSKKEKAMKKITLTLVGIVVILAGCMQEDQINPQFQSDQEALLEMNQALVATLYYNDSLISFTNDEVPFSDSLCLYYDGRYHFYDSLYNMHHNDYTHMNDWDDHQGGMGGMMGGNSGTTTYAMHMNNENHQNINHQIGDHYLMDSIHTAHEPYHPDN